MHQKWSEPISKIALDEAVPDLWIAHPETDETISGLSIYEAADLLADALTENDTYHPDTYTNATIRPF